MCLVVTAYLTVLLLGEKKLGRVITPDTWKDGARNTTGHDLLLDAICTHCFTTTHHQETCLRVHVLTISQQIPSKKML